MQSVRREPAGILLQLSFNSSTFLKGALFYPPAGAHLDPAVLPSSSLQTPLTVL